MTNVDLQFAYLLHSKPYRNTSLLVELLTPDYGRVSGVIKGVRSASKIAKHKRSLLEPLNPLLVSWRGKSDLKTIIHIETRGPAIPIQGKALFCALYINELLIRLLHHLEAQPEVYALYEGWLASMTSNPDAESIELLLRRFELSLLSALGYGLPLGLCGEEGAEVNPQMSYRFDPDQSLFFEHKPSELDVPKQWLFLGDDLLSIAADDFTGTARSAAKRLCRLALKVHLGEKPLMSRELFK